MASEGKGVNQAFDLPKFKPLFTDERKDLVNLARTAELAERYEDMCKCMRELVQWSNTAKQDLTVEERNLLSVAYKNVIGARRASWRTLNADERKDDKLVIEYKKQVEGELRNICKDVLDLLENVLIKNNIEENESRVFYLKMTGDYYRYLAEFVTTEKYDQQAANFYQKALVIAEQKLHPLTRSGWVWR